MFYFLLEDLSLCLKQTSILSTFHHLEPLAARLNHGSFGAAPRAVLDVQACHRAEWAANPDGPLLKSNSFGAALRDVRWRNEVPECDPREHWEQKLSVCNGWYHEL
jgi:hypothetical protein